MNQKLQAKIASSARPACGNSYQNRSALLQSLDAAIRWAQTLGVERLDAQWLLLHALGRPTHDRAWLLAHAHDALDPHSTESFAALCTRRLADEPMGYLLGQQDFHGLRLAVDARVLVPRADTETLVDWAIDRLDGLVAPRVLDLGTGSGAIALAVQKARPDALVDAVECSADALAVARANATALELPVRFAQGNWLDSAAIGYVLIVSNPPYVAEGDAHLAALRHEPIGALTAGPDGLDDLRTIIEQAPAHLEPGGWLLLEHAYDQAAAVRQLLESRDFDQVQSRADMAGIERCSGGCRPAVK